ncbi:General control protein [Ophidiomyces ophidiicola]|nr:General control protein [Ophidiomyces ophidiicola]
MAPSTPSSQPQASAISVLPPQSDFVLFPAPARPVPQHWNSRPVNSLRVAHQSPPVQGVHLSRRSYHPYRKPLAQSLRASIAQDSRATSLVNQPQGFARYSTRPHSFPGATAPPAQRILGLSASANSSPSLRPPVPLFPGTENIQLQYQLARSQALRRKMSPADLSHDLGALLDFSAETYAEGFRSPEDCDLFDSPKVMNFASVNTVSTTVSPKDLMLDSSAPPSASFTDLSTPSFDSPGYFSQDTSPLFGMEELGPGHENWESLFPADSVLAKMDTKVEDKPAMAPASAPPMTRTPSSPGASPKAGRVSTRPSSISGVKPRNRDKPLPPIVFDTADPIAAKRARNTEAARKSRARKVEAQDKMERRIAELEKDLAECQQREAYWKSVAEARQ